MSVAADGGQWTCRSYAATVELALARQAPEAPAFVDADGATTSYGDARRHFAACTAGWAARGLRAGTGVGVLAPNGSHTWLAQWAAVAAGGRITPLHPAASAEDQAFVARDAELEILLVGPGTPAPRVADLRRRMPGITVVTATSRGLDGDDAPTPTRDRTHVVSNATREVELLAYTGGTTGRPKGVMLGTRSLMSNLLIQLAEWPWPVRPVFYAAAPITHAAGLLVLPTLWRGGSVVLAERFDASSMVEAVQRRGVSVSFLVPTMLYALLDEPATTRADLSSLRMLVYGAAPILPARARQALDVLGPVLLQLYGQTEAPNAICSLVPEDHDPAHPSRLASCGRPAAGLQVAVQDREGHEVAVGDVGELCVRGPLVMSGYWRRPEETAAALEHGWLHTGDLATRDEEGYVTLVGRLKDVIITGGFNVYPAEVESALVAEPDVAAAAVVGVPHERWGEAVTAYVVPEAGMRPDPRALTAAVRLRRGAIHAPKAVHLLDALPLTPLGKVDREALRVRDHPALAVPVQEVGS